MADLYRAITVSDDGASFEALIGAFRRILAAPPPREFTLLNFYKGIRIEYGAEVVEAGEGTVRAIVHPYQEAAIRVIGWTFAKGARLPGEYLAAAEIPDPPDGGIRLSAFRPIVILADKREFLRVQFSPPPPAEVIHKGIRQAGRLLDISPRSAAVLLPPGLPLKPGYRARVRAAVGPSGGEDSVAMDAEGDVVRIAEEGGMQRTVFALLPDARVEQAVSRIVGTRQREILRELKEIVGIP